MELELETLHAAALRYIYKHVYDVRDDATAKRIADAASEGGVFACDRHAVCVKVCPKDIPLTDSIAKAGRDATLYKIRQWFGR